MKFEDRYCVIMAGGTGSRFWPVSTKEHPKQFKDILGIGKTMLQITCERVKNLVPKENIYIITNAEYVALVSEQLPDIAPANIVGEPMMKNTAACNAFMAAKIIQTNPEAQLLVLPSDHLILDQQNFEKKVSLAFKEATENQALVTIGIKPTRPETGYGYIHFDENKGEQAVKEVITFTEKPDLETAEAFLKKGSYLWNSGIFIWQAKDILQCFQQFLPTMYQKVQAYHWDDTNQEQAMKEIYPTLEAISIDKGILEKATNVRVILADLGWSDLGTWSSVYENGTKDEQLNVDNSKHVMTYASQGNIIHIDNPRKKAVIDSLNDFIIVDTDEALLICPRAHDQKIKEYVSDLKNRKK